MLSFIASSDAGVRWTVREASRLRAVGPRGEVRADRRGFLARETKASEWEANHPFPLRRLPSPWLSLSIPIPSTSWISIPIPTTISIKISIPIPISTSILSLITQHGDASALMQPGRMRISGRFDERHPKLQRGYQRRELVLARLRKEAVVIRRASRLDELHPCLTHVEALLGRDSMGLSQPNCICCREFK